MLIQSKKLTELSTMVDLGANFYVQAKVPKTDRIFINVGLGFHVEFTLDEALKFVEKKEAELTLEGEKISKKAADIKARINLITQAVAEIMELDTLDRKVETMVDV
eukprot:TRINITY_DN8450_c0_g1_i1.p1 TRINITY_DN8450_c0_g1~~TRINITY_DN8450_c0_g1_i1.p1  ORF type:complete len:120 (+),score=0.70 TRINITY_DN8450_c0_g1_i1:45-362(+)